MHVKGTGEELMKLPTQYLPLHCYNCCLLNPIGMFYSFPQFLHISLSATEAEAAQQHRIHHNSDLYLD